MSGEVVSGVKEISLPGVWLHTEDTIRAAEFLSRSFKIAPIAPKTDAIR